MVVVVVRHEGMREKEIRSLEKKRDTVEKKVRFERVWQHFSFARLRIKQTGRQDNDEGIH
jgi:hypothetical protein